MSENVQRNGLLGGVASILLLFALYFVNPKMIFQWYAFLPYLIVFPAFMTLAAQADKKDNEGFLNFGKAFQSAWITGAISLFLMVVFNYLLMVVIDPSLVDVQIEASKDMAMWSLETFGGGQELSEDEINEMMANIEESAQTPGIGMTFFSYAVMAILGAVPALIIAAIVKKNEDPLAKIQANENVLDD